MTLKGVVRRIKKAMNPDRRSAMIDAVLSIPRPFEDLTDDKLDRVLVRSVTCVVDGLYGVVTGKAMTVGLKDASLNKVGRTFKVVELTIAVPTLVIGAHERWVRARIAWRQNQVGRLVTRLRHPSAGASRAS